MCVVDLSRLITIPHSTKHQTPNLALEDCAAKGRKVEGSPCHYPNMHKINNGEQDKRGP